MWQTVDLTKYVDSNLIDSGTVNFNFSAWLGGYINQDDSAQTSINFFDNSNQLVGNTATLGPVLAVDRSSVTSLLPRSITSVVPIGARTVTVLVTMIRAVGYLANGDADNIVLYFFL